MFILFSRNSKNLKNINQTSQSSFIGKFLKRNHSITITRYCNFSNPFPESGHILPFDSFAGYGRHFGRTSRGSYTVTVAWPPKKLWRVLERFVLVYGDAVVSTVPYCTTPL